MTVRDIKIAPTAINNHAPICGTEYTPNSIIFYIRLKAVDMPFQVQLLLLWDQGCDHNYTPCPEINNSYYSE